MFVALSHALENDAPHELLVQSLAREVREHQAAVAEAMFLRAFPGLRGNGARNGIKILPLLAR